MLEGFSWDLCVFTVLTSWIVTLSATIRRGISWVTVSSAGIGRGIGRGVILGERCISWCVKVVSGVFTSLEIILVLIEDIDGSLDSLDSLIGVLESSIIRSDGISELSLSLVEELSVEVDLLLEGILLVFVGG